MTCQPQILAISEFLHVYFFQVCGADFVPMITKINISGEN